MAEDKSPIDRLHLNLLENSFDYFTASLEYVVRARQEQNFVCWKFALLNLIFAIELLLKEKLRRAHPLLIYSDLERYREISRDTKTVSWNVLIERNKYILGKKFIEIDSGRLNFAQNLRNQILHFDVQLEFPRVYHEYVNLLNFYTNFFRREISESENDTLHNFVPMGLWQEHDDISDAFVESVVFYNGLLMTIDLRDEIIAEQKRKHLTINGELFERIPHGYSGENTLDPEITKSPCHDCSVILGQIHLLGCDTERCPRCRQQLITCGCLKNSLS